MLCELSINVRSWPKADPKFTQFLPIGTSASEALVEVKDFLLHNQMEPLCIPVTPQKNYAKDQKHCSDSNVCPISVKEYGRDDHQQARK